MMKRQLLIFSISIIALLLFIPAIYAQSGSWISQTISGNPVGNALTDCGETCAGVTWQSTQYVYFFDINSSQWMEVDLGSARNFHHLFAKGNVVIAFADTLVIGYSAILSQWDTLRYEGTPLDPDIVGANRSYGCGENLAYFLTDTHFYIFDSQLGTWQADTYTLPQAYTSGSGEFWSRGDYAAAILPSTAQNGYFNIAYSLPAHDFAQLAEGVGYYDPNWRMNHGFAASRNNNLFAGYSAITNQFSVISHGGSGGDAYLHDQFSENTVYAFYYNEVVSSHHTRLHMLGYDTRSGYWTEDTLAFNPSFIDIGPGHQLDCGGQLAFASGTDNTVPSSPSSIYLIYSGLSGQWSVQTPGIAGNSFGPGGKLVAYFDTSSVWFYSIEQNQSRLIPISNEMPAIDYAGDNFYIISCTKQESPDSMETIFYNSTTDSWKRKTMWNAMWFKGSPQMCLFRTGGTNHEIYFYSSLVDNYIAKDFPSDPYSIANLHVNGNIGATSGTDFFGIYDATNNTVHTENYYIYITIPNDEIGTSAAVFKKDSYTLKTYSVLTHQWSEFTIAEEFDQFMLFAKEYIGLIRTFGDNKFYVFNGYYGNLVPLNPAGSHVDAMVGGKTALIVRDNTIYAFDPQAVTGISEPQDIPSMPSNFYLSQNYPNPFNPSTKIRWQTPIGSWQTLKVFDVLGNQVATLVDEYKPAGIYNVQFSMDNLASDIYFYQLKAGKFIETKKMILLK
jgi:hypothetical protein